MSFLIDEVISLFMGFYALIAFARLMILGDYATGNKGITP